ncbi:MAG: LysM peptidoglycan-binding domain-containing protein [Clostridia bacterium]|nr:LysM peptidoglycan-binding domain-containing protein [Clostridia bacterium]
MLFLNSKADTAYTVQSGDSLWKIATKFETGISELKSANPQIKNAALIYPGDVLTIPSSDVSTAEFENEVIRLTNEERAKYGLQPLQRDWELCRVARYKSKDMQLNRYFSHQSPVYGTPFEMIKNFGLSYRAAGENIAAGYRTPKAVVNGWMNSSGHRANILNKTYTHIGVGFAKDGYYWTQMFISR